MHWHTACLAASLPTFLPFTAHPAHPALLQDLFAGSAATSKQALLEAGALPPAAAGAAVVPGPVFRRMMAELGEDAEQLLVSLEGLVAACSGGQQPLL